MAKSKYKASEGFETRAPVKPRKIPILFFIFPRKKVDPTSGTRPIPVSGIAKIVFSVKTRMSPWRDRPTPPPITIPTDTDEKGKEEEDREKGENNREDAGEERGE